MTYRIIRPGDIVLGEFHTFNNGVKIYSDRIPKVGDTVHVAAIPYEVYRVRETVDDDTGEKMFDVYTKRKL